MEHQDQSNFFDAAPLSVAQFIGQINAKIKPINAKIIGEVSEAKPGPTGHVYFSLKDENGGAVIPCAIWKSRYNLFGIELKVGMKIIATGHCEIYPPSGRLSFICDSIELSGVGALKAAYDRLFKKLESEGLFAAKKKRPIPRFARKIGIITSRQGAVIHDFLNNIGKFGFQIEFIDSRVEGQLAAEDLLAAIKTFKKRKVEVLVVMRGGGSLEAMMAFNNEFVTRAIAAFPAPVIAAIGHDKDVPLAAMAADAAVSTPTAAANLLTSSWQEIFRALDHYENIIFGSYKKNLEQNKSELARRVQILANFKFILGDTKRRLESIITKAIAAMENGILAAKQNIAHWQILIESHDPNRQLKLGYAIAKINGKIIKSIKHAKVGQDLDIILGDGIINSNIKKIYDRKKEN